MGVAVGLLGPDGRYIWWSDESVERLGWSADDVLGRNAVEFVVRDGFETPGRGGLHLREANRWHGRVAYRHADGSCVELKGFAVPLLDATGAIEGYLTGAVSIEQPSDRQVGLIESVVVRSEDAVVFCDGRLDGQGPTIVYANQAACDLAGLDLAELIGRPVLSLIASDAKRRMSTLALQLVAGRRVREEFEITHADGRALTVEIELTPFGAVGRAVCQMVLVVHDITERREAERAAAEREARLRMAAELTGVGAWDADVRTGKTVWDHRMRELLGVDETMPATFENWFRLLRSDKDAAAVNLAQGSDIFEANYRMVLPDGSERRLLTRGRIIEREEDGRPARLMGIAVDVTESHAALDRVVSTLESITDGYYALDRNWCFTYLNRWAEDLLGQKREHLLGKDARLEFPDAVGTVIESSYERGMQGEHVEFEAYFAPHDRWYDFRVYPQADGIAVHFRDIDARRAAQAEREGLLVAERAARAELAHAATHDHLTDLPNRLELEAWLTRALDKDRSGSVAVLFCDVDRFKVVNDSLGHAAGDELLVAVARRLGDQVRPGDLVARVGGDEFVVALSNACAVQAEVVAARVLESFREPITVADRRLVLSASVGIALAEDGATAETLLRDADAALYLAKDRGRDQVARFDEDVRTGVVTRLQLEHDLRDALVAEDELLLHYQPAFDLRTGAATGAEALLRWQHPERGLLMAGAFIDLAEDTGLVAALGDWALPVTAVDRAGWAPELATTLIWVNVSVRQLCRTGFARHFLGLLAASGTSPERIGVEVTESALGDENMVALRELGLLSASGIRIAIDDFGTGYSSVARLRQYPVDVLKLDCAFVADLHTVTGRAIVAAVIDLAHAVGATALAEGVENAEQLAALRQLGCDEASGYHLARPVPAGRLGEVIAAAPV